MSTESTNLLRRTLALLGAALSLTTGTTALGQTVTLTGATGNSCSYSQMTVTPNGNITVNCGTATNPTIATFALSHASASSNYVLSPNTSSSATVTRTGGPTEAIMIQFSTAGNGCSPSSGGIMLNAGQSSTIPFSVGAAGTECTVTIGALTGGHIANPNTIRFTAQSGTNPPPPPPPPPPTGVPGDCPAIPSTAVAGDTAINDFTSFKPLRMASGQVGYFPVPASPNPASVVVELSQVADVLTMNGAMVSEFQVSRCPGSWNPPGHTIPTACTMRNIFTQLNAIKIWHAGTSAYPNQASLDAYPGNCMAPSQGGQQYYVNVRWELLATCQYGSAACGFSYRWNQFGSSSPY